MSWLLKLVNFAKECFCCGIENENSVLAWGFTEMEYAFSVKVPEIVLETVAGIKMERSYFRIWIWDVRWLKGNFKNVGIEMCVGQLFFGQSC